MKWFVPILLLLFVCCKKRDAALETLETKLKPLLEAANNDSLSFAIRHAKAMEAFQILQNRPNDSIGRVNLFKVANRFYNMSATNDYKKISSILISQSLSAKDSVSLSKAYTYLGDYYSNSFLSDSAYSYFNKAEKIYKALGEKEKIAKSLLSKSALQFNEKDYIGSEKSSFEALKYLRSTDSKGLQYDANNLLGIIYNELNEYDKSLYYHKKALEISSQKDFPDADIFLASSLNNIGLVFQNKNEDRKAIEYFKKSLAIKDLFNKNPSGYAYILNNLGYSELKIHEYSHLPNLFFQSLKISDSLKTNNSIISSKLHLSQYYLTQKDSFKSKLLADDALGLSKKSKLPGELLLSLKQLIKVDTKNIVKYSEDYLRINDSLQLAERKIRNKLARIEFETEELTIEKDKLVEQRKGLIYIALGVLTIVFFIFIIRSQAAKNRELVLIQEQQRANEDVYQLMLTQQNKIEEVRQLEKKRIAQELHDGVLGKLFGTRMNLGVLNAKNDDKSVVDRSAFIDELKNLEQEIREISHDLNSEKAAIFNNFVLMVNNFIATQRSVCQADIELYMDDHIDWNAVDNSAKINLYRILQEAFQNVNKHANATSVIVNFFQKEGALHLDIKDNGIGFVYSRKKKGIGLQNMSARIKDSKGTMDIVSSPEQGTLLQFELPGHS